jgi:hypothetical protein
MVSALAGDWAVGDFCTLAERPFPTIQALDNTPVLDTSPINKVIQNVSRNQPLKSVWRWPDEGKERSERIFGSHKPSSSMMCLAQQLTEKIQVGCSFMASTDKEDVRTP